MMKLGDAIKVGSLLYPQAFFRLFTGEASCAWGSAYLAIGMKVTNVYYQGEFPPAWNWVLNSSNYKVNCPKCNYFNNKGVGITISHLNDFHGMDRQEIGDWVNEHNLIWEKQNKSELELVHDNQ